ncbi:DUF6291 domain-containing protein [Bacteroides cellulosilyticus]|jgi:hypothetical protein|uniref:DUF6291 domain-containing protein n=1 Tax=Bacteroides cellulosilyticus TaxID=246787 RepID=UPI0018ACEAC6|nr:DUF6291 domain-containing protein [Bacteroides cellulosilyticus]
MRESFVFYRSFYDAIKDLPRDVQGEIYTAIMEYSLYGKETENLKPIARSVFTLMKPQIDVNNKRFENGKRGGRPKSEDKPKGNQNETKEKSKNNQNETKDEPNVNVNDNVYTENTTNVVSKKDAAKAATLKRKEEFYQTLVPFVGKYGREMIRAFFEYWSELNKPGTKMRCEMQKTWEVNLRLATWAKNEKPQYGKSDTGVVLHDNSQSKYDEKLW